MIDIELQHASEYPKKGTQNTERYCRRLQRRDVQKAFEYKRRNKDEHRKCDCEVLCRKKCAYGFQHTNYLLRLLLITSLISSSLLVTILNSTLRERLSVFFFVR